MLPIVLSVDDDPSSHILMRAFLEDEEFCEHFVSASSPSQGLEILQRLDADPHSSLPTLIFCDIHMPEMSGWEFISRARPYLGDIDSNGHPENSVVIMLTATVTAEDEQLASSNPLIHSVFEKPLNLKLLAQVRELDKLRSYFKSGARQTCF